MASVVGIHVESLPALHDPWRLTVAQVAPVLPYLLLVLVLIVRPTGRFGTWASSSGRVSSFGGVSTV